MAKKSKSTIATGEYDYERVAIRNKDGSLRYSSGNMDAVAKAMLIHVADGGTTEQVVSKNKLDVKPKGKRSEGLFRMAIGGALRAKVRAGEPVIIGKITVKSLKQKIALPKVEVKSAPRKKSAKRSPRKTKPAESVAEAA